MGQQATPRIKCILLNSTLPFPEQSCILSLMGYARCRQPLLASCDGQKLSFGRLGASIVAPRGHPGEPFWHSGGTWKKQDRHAGVLNRIFIDFGSISRTCFA